MATKKDDDIEFDDEMKAGIREMCADEYLPSPLQPFDLFVRKKEAEFKELTQEAGDRISNGLIEFSLMETESPRIKDVFKQFLAMPDPNPDDLLGKDAQGILDTLAETNRCGLEKEDFDIMIKMADAVDDAGDHKKAIALYKSLTFVFPNRLEPWIRWGNVEYQHYDPKAALKIFQECQSLFTHPLIDLCIARCFIEMSDFNNAKISLEKTIAGAEAANDQGIKEQAVFALDQIKTF